MGRGVNTNKHKCIYKKMIKNYIEVILVAKVTLDPTSVQSNVQIQLGTSTHLNT